MRQVIINQALADQLAAERVARVALRDGSRYDSEALCLLQQKQAARGVLEAELVRSNYGWSLRYASGLQNFGIIAGSRSGQLDGSYDAALAYATKWAAQDGSRRYVTCSELGA